MTGVNKIGLNNVNSNVTSQSNTDKKHHVSKAVIGASLVGLAALASVGIYFVTKGKMKVKPEEISKPSEIADEALSRINKLKEDAYTKFCEAHNARKFHDMEQKIGDQGTCSTLSEMLVDEPFSPNKMIYFTHQFGVAFGRVGVKESDFVGGKLINNLNKKPSMTKEGYMRALEGRSEEQLLAEIKNQEEKINIENSTLDPLRRVSRAITPVYFSEEFKELKTITDEIMQTGKIEVPKDKEARVSELFGIIKKNILTNLEKNGIGVQHSKDATAQDLKKFSQTGKTKLRIYDIESQYPLTKGEY